MCGRTKLGWANLKSNKAGSPETALKLPCPLKATINPKWSMGFKFAVSALYIDTFFQGNCDKKFTTYNVISGKKSEMAVLFDHCHYYLENELLNLAFTSLSCFCCVLD